MTKNKHRFIPLLLAVAMILSLLPAGTFAADVVDSGTCGEGVTWTLDSDGLLTISGTGVIANMAFFEDEDIVSVVIEDGVTGIGDNAFAFCDGLKNITLPDSLTAIYGNPFHDTAYQNDDANWTGDVLYVGNHLITSREEIQGDLTIPDGTVCVAEGAFAERPGLTGVTIPDSVTNIGFNAFFGCSALTRVTIPDGATWIGGNAFTDTAFFNDENNWTDGDLYIGNHLIAANREIQGDYTIKNGTVSIAANSFAGCSGLTGVTIPDSVKIIGPGAFYGCSGLTEIKIPDGVTTIDFNTFTDCSGLTEITIPDSVTSIGGEAFTNCSGLTEITIPDGVTHIGVLAFYDCDGITEVDFPESVTYIGERAFFRCDGLKDISVAEGNAAYRSSGNCVIDTRTKELVLGSDDSVIPDDGSVESIGRFAFSARKGLTNVMIPDGVTSIEGNAFAECYGLTGVTIPDSVTDIGGNAFSGCSGLMEITIPDGVTSIGLSAFRGCSGLTEITIPDSVNNIGSNAFEGCSGLKSVTIPDNAAQIGYSVFKGTAYYNDENNWTDDVLYIGNHLIAANQEIQGDYTIRNGAVSIAAYSFTGCSGLTGVTIPDSVKNIGPGAFYGCSGLTEITIPVGVTTIDINAFNNCSGLTEITIPDGVISIEDQAFHDCSGLISVNVPGSVTDIGDYAFSGCDSIADVFYSGTQQQWNGITISSGNERLKNAAIHFAEQPAEPPAGDNMFSFGGEGVTFRETEKSLIYASSAALTKSQLVAAMTVHFEHAVITVEKDGFPITDDAPLGTGALFYVYLSDEDMIAVSKTVIFMGDTDGDGTVNATDARLALRAAAKLDTLEGAFGSAADTDGDGNINATDARGILRAAAKLDVLKIA